MEAVPRRAELNYVSDDSLQQWNETLVPLKPKGSKAKVRTFVSTPRIGTRKEEVAKIERKTATDVINNAPVMKNVDHCVDTLDMKSFDKTEMTQSNRKQGGESNMYNSDLHAQEDKSGTVDDKDDYFATHDEPQTHPVQPLKLGMPQLSSIDSLLHDDATYNSMTLGAMPGSPSKVKMVHEHNIQYIKLEDEIDIDSGDSFYKDAEQVATLHNNNFGARHFKNRQPYKTKMIKYDELQHLKPP